MVSVVLYIYTYACAIRVQLLNARCMHVAWSRWCAIVCEEEACHTCFVTIDSADLQAHCMYLRRHVRVTRDVGIFAENVQQADPPCSYARSASAASFVLHEHRDGNGRGAWPSRVEISAPRDSLARRSWGWGASRDDSCWEKNAAFVPSGYPLMNLLSLE